MIYQTQDTGERKSVEPLMIYTRRMRPLHEQTRVTPSQILMLHSAFVTERLGFALFGVCSSTLHGSVRFTRKIHAKPFTLLLLCSSPDLARTPPLCGFTSIRSCAASVPPTRNSRGLIYLAYHQRFHIIHEMFN